MGMTFCPVATLRIARLAVMTRTTFTAMVALTA